ncbi:MAG: glycosyl transferase [Candidatus Latescibacteria bacterium]|nr:glycosyl transferase [Candidatus Latescibacterota bacterium]
MTALWPLALAFALSCALTWVMWRGARRWGALDQPNPRSAHRRPTPTLGGVGVVAGVWGALLTGVGMDQVPAAVAWPLLAGSLALLPAIRDDLGPPLGVAQKMALLLLACGAWLWCGPHLEWLILPGGARLEMGWWGWPLTACWLLYWCNVFNFMDGIDGLTGLQTIAAAGWITLWTWHGAPSLAWFSLALLAAAAGFLVFNLPPARIFMGDVGALSLGFWFAGLTLLAESAGVPLWIAGLPLGCYVYDTTYTLVRRAGRGSNLLRAHNQHLYQRLTRAGLSHRQVDLAVLLLTLLLGGSGQAFLQGAPGYGLLFLSVAGLILATSTLWIENKVPLD